VASRSDIPLAIMCSLEDHTAEQMVHLLNADGPVTAHRYTSCDTKGECQRAVVMEMVIFALEGVIVFCGIVLFCVDQLDRIIKTVCSLASSSCCLVAVVMFAYSTDGTNHKKYESFVFAANVQVKSQSSMPLYKMTNVNVCN